MLPSLIGIIASSGGAAAAAGSYESIATVTVGAGGSASVSFTSIPATYTHLQIRYNAHIEGTANDYSMVKITFNSDTAANYSYHRLFGNGTSASSDASTSQNFAVAPWVPDDFTNSSAFGASVIDVLDYTSTAKAKTIRSLGGLDLNTKGFIALFSGLWFKTPEAVTRIDLTPNTVADFAQYSSFALYGIKG